MATEKKVIRKGSVIVDGKRAELAYYFINRNQFELVITPIETVTEEVETTRLQKVKQHVTTYQVKPGKKETAAAKTKREKLDAEITKALSQGAKVIDGKLSDPTGKPFTKYTDVELQTVIVEKEVTEEVIYKAPKTIKKPQKAVKFPLYVDLNLATLRTWTRNYLKNK